MNKLSTNTESATNETTVADPDTGLIDAVYARHSVRGFLDKEVPEDVLNRLFEIAQQAPSNCNVQPWKVYIASGELKERLKKQMLENTTTGVKSNPDYEYRSDFENEHRVRQVECAIALYTKMGIGRGDKEGRMRAALRNFEYFDAPYIAFIGMDPKFGVPVALDVGMWAQTLMLTMVAFGLHSCPMGTMRNYPDLVREAFDIQDGTKILFGISFGYEDEAVPANETRTTRDDISANIFFRSN